MPDLAELARSLSDLGVTFSAGAAGAAGAPPNKSLICHSLHDPKAWILPGQCRGSAGAAGAQEEEPAPAAPALPRQMPRQIGDQPPIKTVAYDEVPRLPRLPRQETPISNACRACGGSASFGFGLPGRAPAAWFCLQHRFDGEAFLT